MRVARKILSFLLSLGFNYFVLSCSSDWKQNKTNLAWNLEVNAFSHCKNMELVWDNLVISSGSKETSWNVSTGSSPHSSSFWVIQELFLELGKLKGLVGTFQIWGRCLWRVCRFVNWILSFSWSQNRWSLIWTKTKWWPLIIDHFGERKQQLVTSVSVIITD